MILGLLKKRPAAGPDHAESTYAAIVAAARRPAFYEGFVVPDTLPGRFELIVLHAALVFRRLRAEGEDARELSQGVFDVMFRSLEGALREMGVGDLSVPKRMKAMARSFYDGAAKYDAALDANDQAAFAAALRGIVYAGSPADDAVPARLAAYAFSADRALAGQAFAALRADGPAFPEPEEVVS